MENLAAVSSCIHTVQLGWLQEGLFQSKYRVHKALSPENPRDVLKCPQCAQPWEHELPEIVTEQQTPLESNPGMCGGVHINSAPPPVLGYCISLYAGPSGYRNSTAGNDRDDDGGGGGARRRASGSKSHPHSKRSKSRPS